MQIVKERANRLKSIESQLHAEQVRERAEPAGVHLTPRGDVMRAYAPCVDGIILVRAPYTLSLSCHSRARYLSRAGAREINRSPPRVRPP